MAKADWIRAEIEAQAEAEADRKYSEELKRERDYQEKLTKEYGLFLSKYGDKVSSVSKDEFEKRRSTINSFFINHNRKVLENEDSFSNKKDNEKAAKKKMFSDTQQQLISTRLLVMQEEKLLPILEWCGNVKGKLNDTELTQMLLEFEKLTFEQILPITSIKLWGISTLAKYVLCLFAGMFCLLLFSGNVMAITIAILAAGILLTIAFYIPKKIKENYKNKIKNLLLKYK